MKRQDAFQPQREPDASARRLAPDGATADAATCGTSSFFSAFLLVCLGAASIAGPTVAALEVRIRTGLTAPLPVDGPHIRIQAAGPDWVRAWVDTAGLERLRQSNAVFELLRDNSRNDPDYLTYDQILDKFDDWATRYPDLVRLEHIGDSVQGRALTVLRITDQPDVRELEPQVKFVASMHGDEPIAADLCLRFARFLLENYAADAAVRSLVDSTDFYLLPVMNPDGYSANPRTRGNADGTDLNRDFPSLADPVNTTAGRAPETAAVMNWTAAHRFVLSIGFHSGDLGAVYPWGHAADLPPEEQNPETALFREICLTYTAGNPDMWARNSSGWEHGVRNAADWYPVWGEMADWNYRWYGDLEITVEVSTVKEPDNPGFDNSWPEYWDRNRDAMLAFVGMAQRGVRGMLRRPDDVPVPARAAPGRLPVPTDRADRPRARAFLHLEVGWNLISLPLDPDDPAPEAVFPKAEGPAWRWDGVRYQPVSALTAYTPVWIYAAKAIDCTVDGLAAEDDQPSQLRPGWNLMGTKGSVSLEPTSRGALVAVDWDAAAQRYTWVGPGAPLDPLRGYWFFANSATVLDLTEGPNRPLPSRSAAEDGAYFRILLPGRYSMWFEDTTPAGISHTQAVTSAAAGEAITITATATAPGPPLQIFGLDIPEHQARDAADGYLRFDPDLPAAGAQCRIDWSVDEGTTWTETNMTEADADAWQATVTAPATAGRLLYFFQLVRDGAVLATLRDAREPFQIEVVAALRTQTPSRDRTGRESPPAAEKAAVGTSSWSGTLLDRTLGAAAPAERKGRGR